MTNFAEAKALEAKENKSIVLAVSGFLINL